MCDNCGWEEALDHIDTMIERDDVSFWTDNEFLHDLAESVAEIEHITSKQVVAIGNIEEAITGDRTLSHLEDPSPPSPPKKSTYGFPP